jgi:TolB protein
MRPLPIVLSLVAISITPVALVAQRPVTGPPSNILPSVSPDGSWIVFLSDRDSTNSVFVIGADGTGERVVTHGGAQRARWSTNGREINITGEGADSCHVFAVAPDGGNRRVVATVAGRSPALSPDGKLVAYLVGPWTSTAMAVANTDGSDVTPVAGGQATAWNPAWSPDSKRIAYTYGDSSRVLQVHVVNADGAGDSTVTHVAVEEGSAQMPAWSPDGRRLAVQVSNRRTHSGHIWIVDLETGVMRKLAAHAEPYLDEAPAWFPDGEHIAFQSNRSGRMEIWVMKDDGSGQRQVTGSQP